MLFRMYGKYGSATLVAIEAHDDGFDPYYNVQWDGNYYSADTSLYAYARQYIPGKGWGVANTLYVGSTVYTVYYDSGVGSKNYDDQHQYLLLPMSHIDRNGNAIQYWNHDHSHWERGQEAIRSLVYFLTRFD